MDTKITAVQFVRNIIRSKDKKPWTVADILVGISQGTKRYTACRTAIRAMEDRGEIEHTGHKSGMYNIYIKRNLRDDSGVTVKRSNDFAQPASKSSKLPALLSVWPDLARVPRELTIHNVKANKRVYKSEVN